MQAEQECHGHDIVMNHVVHNNNYIDCLYKYTIAESKQDYTIYKSHIYI